MRNKAIILSRVSSFHQDLKQQTEAVYTEVLKDGYKEEDIIVIEDKESAIKLSEEERNGLNRLKEYVNSDSSINAVYLYEMSRLSRRVLVMYSMRDFFIEHKIQLVCLKPYFKLLDNEGEISMMGTMAFSFISGFAESEMAIKKARMLRGRYNNKLNGKTMGGRPTFGYYTNKEKYYVVDEQQSALLKRIYAEYIGGKAIFVIAKELKEEGLFPNCIVHTLSHKIDRWLSAKYLLGNSQYPQIISKSMFDTVQKEKAKRKKAPRKSHKNIFLLKGLIFDGDTDKPIWGQRGIESYCDTHFGGVCIKRNYVDPIVWDVAKTLYRKYVMNPTIYRRQLQKEIGILGVKAENIENEIQSIRDRIDKVEERMIFGHLSTQKGNELLEKLTDLLTDTEHRQLEIINETVAKNQQLNDVELTSDFDETTMSLDEKIAIVKKVVKKVTVKRISKYTAHISIFNCINDIVTVYEAKSSGRYKGRGCTLIDEYHSKEKTLKTRKQSI